MLFLALIILSTSTQAAWIEEGSLREGTGNSLLFFLNDDQIVLNDLEKTYVYDLKEKKVLRDLSPFHGESGKPTPRRRLDVDSKKVTAVIFQVEDQYSYAGALVDIATGKVIRKIKPPENFKNTGELRAVYFGKDDSEFFAVYDYRLCRYDMKKSRWKGPCAKDLPTARLGMASKKIMVTPERDAIVFQTGDYPSSGWCTQYLSRVSLKNFKDVHTISTVASCDEEWTTFQYDTVRDAYPVVAVGIGGPQYLRFFKLDTDGTEIDSGWTQGNRIIGRGYSSVALGISDDASLMAVTRRCSPTVSIKLMTTGETIAELPRNENLDDCPKHPQYHANINRVIISPDHRRVFLLTQHQVTYWKMTDEMNPTQN